MAQDNGRAVSLPRHAKECVTCECEVIKQRVAKKVGDIEAEVAETQRIAEDGVIVAKAVTADSRSRALRAAGRG